ncbi:MAG: ankyrin repeat domain-containing protein [Sphingobacteriia bacterium]|nr:MAG: ankyrin repeat domain-containing protein [Sphingobacteriia bacterium]
MILKTISSIKQLSFLVMIISVLALPACGQNNQSNKVGAKQIAPSIDIHTAVMKGDITAIKQHIAAKPDLNEKEKYGGSTPLISATIFGKTEIAKLLIDAGAMLNIQNNEGSTALITAAFFCRPEIVKMLLAKKADKTIKNKFGNTALETVSASFQDAKPIYDMLGSSLAPLGLKLDYEYLKKTRPVIAAMLK